MEATGSTLRLVSWNANFNNRRRSFRETLHLLEPLCADILILCEVARPMPEENLEIKWVGANSPGMAVVARNGLNIEPCAMNTGAPPLVAGFHVTGAIDFHLLATWTVQPRGGRPNYHTILLTALAHFSGFIAQSPTLMMGDFNSSAGVIAQKRSHPAFIEQAARLGLTSLYHSKNDVAHGNEMEKTFFKNGRSYHIDYCFMPPLVAVTADIQILNSVEWLTRSDHAPLVIDVPYSAFRRN